MFLDFLSILAMAFSIFGDTVSMSGFSNLKGGLYTPLIFIDFFFINYKFYLKFIHSYKFS